MTGTLERGHTGSQQMVGGGGAWGTVNMGVTIVQFPRNWETTLGPIILFAFHGSI